jgi:hypothetical protein
LAQIRQNLPKHANCDFSQTLPKSAKIHQNLPKSAKPAKSAKSVKICKIRKNLQILKKSADCDFPTV